MQLQKVASNKQENDTLIWIKQASSIEPHQFSYVKTFFRLEQEELIFFLNLKNENYEKQHSIGLHYFWRFHKKHYAARC